jgi:hypothetical protein
MTFPSLVLGAFNLTDWSGSAYQTQVIAEGTSKGSPVPLEVAVKSWLQDGSIVVTQGYDNRTVTLRVKLRGLTLTAVSQAEAALFAELGKPNKLTWTPASGPATVFMVVTSSMDHAPSTDEDIAEGLAAYPWRTYNIRLLCEAFTQSASESVSTALGSTGATTTTLDACAATTGWTGTIDGGSVTPTAPSGAVLLTGTVSAKTSHSFSLQKTFAATTSSTNLLQVDWQKPSGGIGITDTFATRLRATGDGTALEVVAEGSNPATGYTRTWFKVTASTLAVTRFDWSGYFPTGGSVQLAIDNVAVTNVNPIIGNGRQSLRSIKVGGSARAPGTLVILGGSTALGNGVIAYVYGADSSATGYTPPLRPWRTSGNTVTTNTALVSGASEPLNGGTVTFTIPIDQFVPKGSYVLMARMMTSGGGTATVSWTASTTVGSNTVNSIAGSQSVTMTAAYQNFALAKLILPTNDVGLDSSGGTLQVTLTASAACTYDEAWLFHSDLGALIQVDCGTNAVTGGKRLFIDSPSVAEPRPTVRMSSASVPSTATDRSGAFTPATVQAWQIPRYSPPQVNLFLVTPNVADPTIYFVYFKHWHTNAAE